MKIYTKKGVAKLRRKLKEELYDEVYGDAYHDGMQAGYELGREHTGVTDVYNPFTENGIPPFTVSSTSTPKGQK